MNSARENTTGLNMAVSITNSRSDYARVTLQQTNTAGLFVSRLALAIKRTRYVAVPLINQARYLVTTSRP